ncbi:ECF RNA polymerase sigma factor SigW [Enhygromyxa salina]|uniref:ECF RNA polymerase sigma factor SigW n=1 Tax=Enhygromyxa salina TaxID=215803 RepID=A0A2S9YJS9_9BACT|nr:sigma-70 family RNA polymerase sigma factor [Enhygromyxa salina]PRQ05349.1 ECF RNA polymerase sigma factor SigW [Enhygromyxa salina]
MSSAGEPTPGEEREIIEGMRAGDDRAFERMVRAHVGPLRAVALRLLQNPADADDAVQEAFLSAFRNFDSFRADARLKTWLHRIVVNVALQRLRRHKRQIARGAEIVDISELLPRFADNGFPEHFHRPWVQTSEELAARAQTREQVRQMIDKLPDNYRTVLILRDIEELDTAETAELLELTPGTVKVRLHRARQALRNLLERELELTH